MKHWIYEIKDRKEVKTEEFFNEIESVCRKYNVSISHEDGHGSFIIELFDDRNIQWLKESILEKDVYDIFK